MNKKIDIVPVVKMAATALSLVATLAVSWATKKETDKTIEKLVNDRLNSK